MAHYVTYADATGALVGTSATDPGAPGPGQSVRVYDAPPPAGATWTPAAKDYLPRAAPPSRALAIRSVQKLSGTIPSFAYPAGSSIKTFPMPQFVAGDPSQTFVENIWWRVTGGTMTALIVVYADVTQPDAITVVVNSPVAQTLTLQVGARVVEYG